MTQPKARPATFGPARGALTHLERRIIDYVREHPGSRVSDVWETLHVPNDVSYTGDALRALWRRGLLRREPIPGKLSHAYHIAIPKELTA